MKNKTWSFRTKLWLYFVLFTAVIFSLLWIMQSVGLQSFYDEMMQRNIRNAAKTIAAAARSEDFFDIIDRLSFEDSLLIYVTDEDGNIYYSSDSYNTYFRQKDRPNKHKNGKNSPSRKDDPAASDQSALRTLPDSYDTFLSRLMASETGSVEFSYENSFICGYRIKLDDDVFEDYFGDDDDKDRDAVLFVAGTLEPVGASAAIIRTQLIWVTGISLVLGFLIAWLIARRFDRPIRQLRAQAKMLSDEHYEDRFQPGFCRELDELNEAMTQSAEKLSEARAYQKELLANVSHDLRTPLTMIKGYAEMLRDVSWEDDEQRNADTGVIIKEADRMTALVNEILEYSRLQEQKQEPRIEDVNFSALTESVLERFEPLFTRDGGTFERDIEPDCFVRGDRELLERAVFNLIDNAVRHSNGAEKRVSVSVRKDEKVCLEVRDCGEGIDPGELPHIWEKYYTSRQRGNQGASGLGLAIVKQTAELHHGEVDVQSTKGEGSTFRLMI